jgi:hypothetical protein
LSKLPPIIKDELFDDLDKSITQVETIFTPVITDLIDYLNELPCLQDIQQIRSEKFNLQRTSTTAFRNHINHLDTGHWYIFNWGGRNEMQFNIGMYSEDDDSGPYVRVGAGFNFQRDGFGNPPTVAHEFSLFCNEVRNNQLNFENFYRTNSLQIENNYEIRSGTVVNWLQAEAKKKPDEHDWVFIGRQLQRGKDQSILEHPKLLHEVIEFVFNGLKPYYKK